MRKVYKAHINQSTGTIQTVKEHSENTADLCAEFAIPMLKDIMYAIGLLHDIGKFQDSFQKRIDGSKLKIEHSICGALVAREQYANPLGLIMEYCISGHHSGIPDGGALNDTADMQTLCGRMKRDTEDYSIYQTELKLPKLASSQFLQFLLHDCNRNPLLVVDKFAFVTRYCFSCLTDADSIDTATFCNGYLTRGLKVDFLACLKRVDNYCNSFVCNTSLQRARAGLQRQAFEKIGQDAEIYLMNMPTGSGKTLCSVKFALERAIQKNKKRIIYIIPYNSIIDQTSETFQNIFQEDGEILRHQSTFSYESSDYSEDYRSAAKNAEENWDAPFIISTAVQYFESIYANKRGKLRKLHNMADSILIFDEAHMMPTAYLQPCLRAIAYITRYLNSEAVFLTATMPDFSELMKHYALPNSSIIDLIEDTSLFYAFKKCRYHYLGGMQEEELLTKANKYPSVLLIVNRRASAKRLYQMCGGRKYHLSTYMTAIDRKRVLDEIREELRKLERDYPSYTDVPEDRRIFIVSTSLIEAGVDIDVHTVFRELSGLDSILQAGGRCNREGRREQADVYIFELEDSIKKASGDERGNIVRGVIEEYKDISCQEAIKEYYSRWLSLKEDEIHRNAITWDCNDIQSIPFREYAEKFEMIDSKTWSVVVPSDDKAKGLVKKLQYGDGVMERELQSYACLVYQWELDDLIRQHVVDDFGIGVYCLTNLDYYNSNIGILFEASDYFIEEGREKR